MSKESNRLEAGRAAFKRLYGENSGVRALAEAARSNNADNYNPAATRNAFKAGLERSVARLNEVSDLFTKKA